MRKRIAIAIIFVILFTLEAFAEVTIKAELDSLQITTDEAITYKLIISSEEKKLPAPQFPEFRGFRIVSQAESSTISLVKRQVKTILVYAYTLAPQDIGKFKIEPSSIKINGKTYSSEAFEVEVTKGKTPLPPPQNPTQEETAGQITL